jgi:hypothetical protein
VTVLSAYTRNSMWWEHDTFLRHRMNFLMIHCVYTYTSDWCMWCKHMHISTNRDHTNFCWTCDVRISQFLKIVLLKHLMTPIYKYTFFYDIWWTTFCVTHCMCVYVYAYANKILCDVKICYFWWAHTDSHWDIWWRLFLARSYKIPPKHILM